MTIHGTTHTFDEGIQWELFSEILRCRNLFDSQVLHSDSIFQQSAFIEILIRLNYVLQALSKNSNRILWIDDIIISKEITDITDLVNYLRNAACHQDSPRSLVTDTNSKFIFCKIYGKNPTAVKIGNKNLGCDYADDVAFYYGDKRIYLNRHIKKLIEALSNIINQH